MPLQILDSESDPACVRLVGELDLSTAGLAAEAILPKCDGSTLSLDLSELTFMDSSGVRVLLEAFKAVSSKGGTFALLSPTPVVRRIIDLLGLPENGVVVREAQDAQG